MNISKVIIFLIIIKTICFGLFAQSNDPEGRWAFEFEIGEKYHIFQHRANIRNLPSMNGEIIAVLSRNAQVELLENSGNQEKINNVWGYWYKIKFGNIIGYTFGGNLALITLITDIEYNGINDYFYFRHSNEDINSNHVWWRFNSLTDIVIYINNHRINTNMLFMYSFNRNNPTLPYKVYDNYFNSCFFVKKINYVLIELVRYGRDDYIWKTVYKVDRNGTIEFYEWREESNDYFYDNDGKLIIAPRIIDRVTVNGDWYTEIINEERVRKLIKQDIILTN
jgi:hypothetical protein